MTEDDVFMPRRLAATRKLTQLGYRYDSMQGQWLPVPQQATTSGWAETSAPPQRLDWSDTQPATPEPVGEVVANEFFAWDAEGGVAFYKTQQEAIDHAKESLNYYLDGANAHGEWDEDVEHVRWGVVMQRAKATNISATEDGESSCDYELQDVATRRAIVRAAAAIGKDKHD